MIQGFSISHNNLSGCQDSTEKREIDNITRLKCTSSYPAPIEPANLRTMVDMRDRFGVEVGLSDHTMKYTVPVVAISLEARMIEKHFFLDRYLGGPDADFSLTPDEFTTMIAAVRGAENALGEVTNELSEKIK